MFELALLANDPGLSVTNRPRIAQAGLNVIRGSVGSHGAVLEGWGDEATETRRMDDDHQVGCRKEKQPIHLSRYCIGTSNSSL